MGIAINANDIMMALGYKDTSANEHILALAAEAAEKANSICDAKYTDRKIAIINIQGNSVALETGDVFECESLAKEAESCSHLIVSIYTIGHKMDGAIRAAFKEGDPLMGMMLDAAGTKLVSYYANSSWKNYINNLGESEGMTKGFTPGSLDFPIEQQKVVFNLLDAKSIDVTLNDSCLMAPAKSISVVYGTGENITNSCVSHSCSGCPRTDCMLRDDRQVEIRIHKDSETKIVSCPIGSNLQDVFAENDIAMEFPCNGRGTCGACSARFVKTVPGITDEDKKHLSKAKIDNGWRLTCKVVVSHPLEVYLPQNEDMQILSHESGGDTEVENYAIAIDIGTTTVVCHLIDADDGNIIDTQASVNRQRKYGADVASRILHEMTDDNGKEHLNRAIISQINDMASQLLERNGNPKIKHVTAVGNTIMIHILLGYDIAGLGQSPYTPVSLERSVVPSKSLGIEIDCDITVIEGMDSYVGADISVGAAYCSLMEDEKYRLLIDLGTNGEIALGNKNRLLCCATAAGPAFEAVNIHNGMSGLPGAVSEFWHENGAYHHKTIGDKPALGICGSGVLDITAVLLETGVIDMTGRMLGGAYGVEYDDNLKEYFKVAVGAHDDIIFTAKDVREIQLAKAAVAAGVKTLIETAKINCSDIEHVYIAGGFGNYMNIESALKIELIPKELKEKITAVGNTAAKGAVACHDKDFLDKVAEYVAKSEHVDLSTSMIFQNHYIESMGFDG